MYALSHPNSDSKRVNYWRQNGKHFAQMCTFEGLIVITKANCMPLFCFIFFRFAVNAFFFNSLILANVCIFPFEQGFKKDTTASKYMVIWLLKFNFQYDGSLYANSLIYILTIYREFLRFRFFSRGIRTQIPIQTVVQYARIRCRKNLFC